MSRLRERLSAFELSPIAAWVDDGRIVWANEVAVKLWQAESLDELLRRDFSDMSEALSQERRGWIDTLSQGSPTFLQRDWTIFPKGTPRHLSCFLSVVPLDDDRPGLLIQAIPRTKSTESKLLREATAVRHLSAALATLDGEGRVLSRNSAAIAAFGHQTPIVEWFEDPGVVPDLLAVAQRDPSHVHRAEVGSRASGRRRYYTLEARRTIDPIDGSVNILVQLLDDTARIQAEREAAATRREADALERALAKVEEQEQRWRALVANAPDLIVLLDPDHRVVFANRGIGGAALGSRIIEEFAIAEDRPRLAAVIDAALESSSLGACEFHSETVQGPRHFSVRVGPIAHGGGVEQVLLMARDVTQQRALEAQLHHSEKMRAVGALAGGIAHDFNNLLSIILGVSEFAANKVQGQSELEDLFTEIRDAGERASRLTRQLLSFSRKQPVEPAVLELNELIRDNTRLLTRALGKHVRLELDLDSEPCRVYANLGQIEQVLMNLTLNARDAMAEDGVLTISTAAPEPAEATILLAVEDTGAGMSPELQARIFEPFFTTKGAGEGTGLGLTMVHSIVEQSGGTLRIDSAIGRGTRFEIRLPSLDAIG